LHRGQAISWRLARARRTDSRRYRQSRSEVEVHAAETQLLIESFQKVANRIAASLIFAALIVGAALLMHIETRFRLFGYPGLAMVCFLGAAAGGLWLVLSVLWQDHKSKQRVRR
jgi:hypothetical protein